MSEPLNQDEEEEIPSNPQNEDEQEDEDGEMSEEEKERIALEVLNRRVGKNYTSMDAVVKSEKERDVLFARTPQKKVVTQEPAKGQPVVGNDVQLDSDTVEAILFANYPELKSSPEALKELKEASKLNGKSMFAIYKDSSYLQGKAKEESVVRKEDEENKPKVNNPGPVPPSKNSPKPTDEDIRIANKYFKGDVERYMAHKVKI